LIEPAGLNNGKSAPAAASRRCGSEHGKGKVREGEGAGRRRRYDDDEVRRRPDQIR